MKIYIHPFLQRQKEIANARNQILKVLNVGCGNSMFGEDMFLDNVGTIVNIDYSSSIIQYMKKRADGILAKLEQTKQDPDSTSPTDDNNAQLEKPQLLFIEMDITKTLFQDNSFDSGTCKSCYLSDHLQFLTKELLTRWCVVQSPVILQKCFMKLAEFLDQEGTSLSSLVACQASDCLNLKPLN